MSRRRRSVRLGDTEVGRGRCCWARDWHRKCGARLMAGEKGTLLCHGVVLCGWTRGVFRLRLSSSYPGRDIGRRDFSTGVDRWQLSLHHANKIRQAIVVRGLPISASWFALSRIGLASQIFSSTPCWWQDLATTVPGSSRYIDDGTHPGCCGYVLLTSTFHTHEVL